MRALGAGGLLLASPATLAQAMGLAVAALMNLENAPAPTTAAAPAMGVWLWSGAAAALLAALALALRAFASERRLRNSDARLHSLLEAAVDAVITIDGQGSILSYNAGAETTFGYSAAEVLGQNVKMLMPSPYRGEHDGYLQRHLHSGQSIAVGRIREVEGQRKNGTRVPLELSVSRVMSPGRPTFVGILRDMSERKRIESELLQAQSQLKAMYDKAPLGMFLTDGIGHCIRVNRAYEELTGLSSEQAVDKGWRAAVHPSDIERVSAEWDAAVAVGAPFSSEFRCVGGYSDVVWVSVQAAPIDSQSRAMGYVGSMTDVTLRKLHEKSLIEHARQIEQAHHAVEQQTVRLLEAQALREAQYVELQLRTVALQEARAAADSASRSKSEFLANMSHEIRTPMTAILGFAELLEESVGDPAQLDAARTIRSNARHLLELINDILDLSKIEAGKLSIERRACSPSELIADVVGLMRVRADAKNLALGVEFRGPLPESIATDPLRVRQCLVNLVGNAIKFTEVGGVRVFATLEHADGEQPSLCFEVIDSGIGMTAEQTSRIFRPFSQADASTTRKFGGTGLGLSITKRLAGLLGGDVELESEPGVGTTFRLRIATGSLAGVRMIAHPKQAASAPQHAAAPAVAEPLAGRRILLVEDGPDNQRLIGFVLRKAGAEVEVAENGRLAVERVLSTRGAGRRATDTARPLDLILMDMQMPVMDGYEATRVLREKGYSGPIVALTAHAMQGDREKCLAAGCDDFATKPINRAALIQLADCWIRRGKLRSQTPGPEESAPCET